MLKGLIIKRPRLDVPGSRMHAISSTKGTPVRIFDQKKQVSK
jgi:hypothetical protein